jgi:hypothetical protein
VSAALLRELRTLLEDAEPRQVLKAGWSGDLKADALESRERLVLPEGAGSDIPRLLIRLDAALRVGTPDCPYPGLHAADCRCRGEGGAR